MRLPELMKDLSGIIEEFDIWITPSLGEISDTDIYKSELRQVINAFEMIGNATDSFASVNSCNPNTIADTLAKILSDKTVEEQNQFLRAIASMLFIVTGKSDNNFKCQFPLFLRDQSTWTTLPSIRRKNISNGPIPRVMKSETYMSLIAQINQPELESKLLREFIYFLLKDEKSINQFWSIGYSYFALKEFNKSEHLLAPLIIFKVRGSVMASGGHEPEDLLRGLMSEWGLRADLDFNTSDVVVAKDNINSESKTRAYDFVLPYKTPSWPDNWKNRIFIQCQFYAGDSGSVSHKNVDQTKSSRDYVSSFVNVPYFIEFVDGAGYFSSLNGDLKKLLSYPDTNGFFQIRSAPIRLRNYFQQIGFLTPLEIEHIVAQGYANKREVMEQLIAMGYTDSEVLRCLEVCEEEKILNYVGDEFKITVGREEIVRRYILLDLIACNGRSLARNELPGKVLVPGFGLFYGISFDKLAEIAINTFPVFRDKFSHSPTFLSDLRFLSEKGYLMMK